MVSVWNWVRSKFSLRTPGEIAEFEERTVTPGQRDFFPREPQIDFRQTVEGPGVQRVSLGGEPLQRPVGEFRRRYRSVVWFWSGRRRRDYTARVEVGVYYWVHSSETNEEENSRAMLNQALKSSGWLRGTWQGSMGIMSLEGISGNGQYFPSSAIGQPSYEGGGFTGEAVPRIDKFNFQNDSRWEVRLEGNIAGGDATGTIFNLNRYPEGI